MSLEEVESQPGKIVPPCLQCSGSWLRSVWEYLDLASSRCPVWLISGDSFHSPTIWNEIHNICYRVGLVFCLTGDILLPEYYWSLTHPCRSKKNNSGKVFLMNMIFILWLFVSSPCHCRGFSFLKRACWSGKLDHGEKHRIETFRLIRFVSAKTPLSTLLVVLWSRFLTRIIIKE